MKKYVWILMLISSMMPCSAFSLPAFPGAEGFGSDTVGGRNAAATVCIVDTLSDNAGDGQTFRECVTASGPRYVVFEVSGIINLTSDLIIDDPYVTIAGQTSPGGILISDYNVQIWAHDVIITHVRFRPGTDAIDYAKSGSDILYYTSPQYSIRADAAACLSGNSLSTKAAGGYPCALSSGMDPELGHRALSVFGDSTPGWYSTADAYNIVIDHCSFGWAVDEVVLFDSAAHDITFSWNITGEGLSRAGHEEGEHSKNLALSGKFEGIYNVSVHHNYLSNSRDRNSYVSGDFDDGGSANPGDRWIDLRNNVVYNGYTMGMLAQGNGAGNWVHNYVRRGPESTINYLWEVAFWDPAPDANNLMYVYGNMGGQRDSQDDPQWCVGNEWRNEAESTNYQKANPYNAGGYSVTTTTMSLTYAGEVVSGAGATKPVTDSVDTRLKNEWTNGTGAIPIDMTDAQVAYPTFDTPSPPTDSDNDGIADAWETSAFGDLDQTANTDYDSDGYSDLEEYIHYLGGYAGEDPEPPAATVPLSGMTCSGCRINF